MNALKLLLLDVHRFEYLFGALLLKSRESNMLHSEYV